MDRLGALQRVRQSLGNNFVPRFPPRTNEGRLMYTIGLALTLRPGMYDGYKRAHDELWSELAEGMRANDVSMAIYRDADRLFVFGAAPSEAHWYRSRQHPILVTRVNSMCE